MDFQALLVFDLRKLHGADTNEKVSQQWQGRRLWLLEGKRDSGFAEEMGTICGKFFPFFVA